MTKDLAAAVDALSSDDVFTRAQAVATLQQNAVQARAPTTAVLVDANSSEVARIWAALALGQIGDDDSRQVAMALRAALKDPSPSVRWAALGALGKLCDPLTRDAIAAHLHDDEEMPGAWFDDDSRPSHAARRALDAWPTDSDAG